MVTDPVNPGVLDFQDAVVGAVTYDLVSLLRDCYIAWPREQVERWVLDYRARLRALGMSGLDDAGRFLRWFDLMGVQRHLKAIGIFARLKLRDGKDRLPATFPDSGLYMLEVANRHAELTDLRDCCGRGEWIAGSSRCEGDDSRRRARRTDAAADRSHAQTAAAGRWPTTDRPPNDCAAGGGHRRTGDQYRPSGRATDVDAG